MRNTDAYDARTLCPEPNTKEIQDDYQTLHDPRPACQRSRPAVEPGTGTGLRKPQQPPGRVIGHKKAGLIAGFFCFCFCFRYCTFAAAFELVGVAGFEPTTTCPPGKCATKLRYTPISGANYSLGYSGIVQKKAFSSGKS